MSLDLALALTDVAPRAVLDAVRAAIGLPAGTRLVAAMSGGVDSSVVAALVPRTSRK